MSGLRAIVSPRLVASLSGAGHFPQTVTIQRASRVRDAYGEPVETWGTLAGHAALSAAIAPAGGTEIASATGIYADASATILLAGEYAAIATGDRAVDGSGRVWDILAIEIGPHGSAWTNLIARERVVGG